MRRQRLPFAAHVVYSEDDPFCRPSRAQALATDWGAEATTLGARGHINGDSGLGDWPQGRAWLLNLAQPAATRSPPLPG
jgi:predicted alpha/beta hydrolase family esterase